MAFMIAQVGNPKTKTVSLFLHIATLRQISVPLLNS